MDRTLRFLRATAVSLCIVLCTLVVMLWVRSYWRHDDIKFLIFNRVGSLESLRGECGLMLFDPGDLELTKSEPTWNAESFPVTEATRGWYESNEPFTSVFVMRWQFWPNGFVFAVSYWFVVVICAAFAVILIDTRFHRFSLRALLVAMSLAAFLLGIIALAKR